MEKKPNKRDKLGNEDEQQWTRPNEEQSNERDQMKMNRAMNETKWKWTEQWTRPNEDEQSNERDQMKNRAMNETKWKWTEQWTRPNEDDQSNERDQMKMNWAMNQTKWRTEQWRWTEPVQPLIFCCWKSLTSSHWNFGSQSMKKRKSHPVAEQWSQFPRGVDQIHINNIFD